MNRIILIGRLTASPELRYLPDGRPVVRFRLAVDRPRRSGDGGTSRQEADFFNVVVFSGQAEAAARYLEKGRLVAVDGRMQIREYQDRDGARRWAAEVVAQQVEFLSRPQASQAGKAEPEAAATAGEASPEEEDFDEVPF